MIHYTVFYLRLCHMIIETIKCKRDEHRFSVFFLEKFSALAYCHYGSYNMSIFSDTLHDVLSLFLPSKNFPWGK